LRQTILLECVTRSAHATHLTTLLHTPDWRSRFTPTLAAGPTNGTISPKWKELARSGIMCTPRRRTPYGLRVVRESRRRTGML
jgi:hypothetical protein